MKVDFYRFVVAGRNDAVSFERSNCSVVFSGEGFAQRARAGRSCDDVMRRMRLDQRLGEELPAEKIDVVAHRQDCRLVVKML